MGFRSLSRTLASSTNAQEIFRYRIEVLAVQEADSLSLRLWAPNSQFKQAGSCTELTHYYVFIFLFQVFHNSSSISSPHLSSSHPSNATKNIDLLWTFSKWYLAKYPTTSKMKHLRRTWTFQESFVCDQNETFPLDTWGLWSQTRHVNTALFHRGIWDALLCVLFPQKIQKDFRNLKNFPWDGMTVPSISVLILHRGGPQVRTLMPTMLIIPKRTTGNMLQVFLIFLQKKPQQNLKNFKNPTKPSKNLNQ